MTATSLSTSRPARRPTFALIAVTTIATAIIIGRGLAKFAADSEPEAVVSLGLPSPEALLRLSEKQRRPEPANDSGSSAGDADKPVQPDLAAAWTSATRALSLQPLDAQALRLLGQIAEEQGHATEAEQLMAAAGKRSIRDSLADVWLANDSLGRKDYARALDQIDGLLRTNPNMGPSVFPLLAVVAVTPESIDTLVTVLARDPPWRAGFLTYLPTRVQKADSLNELYLKLMNLRPVLPNEELKPYLDALIRQNFIEQAYYLWTKTLPPSGLANLGYLYNGDFQATSSGLPFDWVIDPIEGAKAEIKNYPHDDQRRALSVEFGSGGRVPFKNVTEMTLIPPGHYRLSGEYRADQLTNRRGMTWRLYCAESGAMVAETPRVTGTTDGWFPFEVTFDIPDQDCRAQWLRLELAYRVDIEQEVSGSIWYDNLVVDRSAPGENNAADLGKMRIRMPNAASNFETAIQKPQ